MNIQTDIDCAKKRILSLDDLKSYLLMYKDGAIIKHYPYEISFDGMCDGNDNTNIIGMKNNKFFSCFYKNGNFLELKYFNTIQELVESVLNEIKIAIEYYKKTYKDKFVLVAQEDAFIYFLYNGKEYTTNWQAFKGCYELRQVVEKSENEYSEYICDLWDFEKMGISDNLILYRKDSWENTKKYIIERISENC